MTYLWTHYTLPPSAGFLGTFPVIAQSNLPRAWASDPNLPPGQSFPMNAGLSHKHPTRIGGDFDEGMMQVFGVGGCGSEQLMGV